MISKKDETIILQCARKYGVSAVVLFGSSIRKGRAAHDIDIGVHGIEPRRFFDFYAELYKKLSKPVDLVDLSKPSRFNKLIEESGLTIYGHGQSTKREKVSINQFISSAVSEKISALLTEDYLKIRAKKAKKDDFRKILAKVPGRRPLPGDEL